MRTRTWPSHACALCVPELGAPWGGVSHLRSPVASAVTWKRSLQPLQDFPDSTSTAGQSALPTLQASLGHSAGREVTVGELGVLGLWLY